MHSITIGNKFVFISLLPPGREGGQRKRKGKKKGSALGTGHNLSTLLL